MKLGATLSKKLLAALLASALALAAIASTGIGTADGATNGVSASEAFEAVNPWIGTGFNTHQNKGNSAYGNTWPGAAMPFGMTQFTEAMPEPLPATTPTPTPTPAPTPGPTKSKAPTKVKTKTTLKVSEKRLTGGAKEVVTVTVSPSSADGRVALMYGSRTLKTLTLKDGKAEVTLALAAGTQKLSARFLGSAGAAASRSATVAVKVARRAR
ncbi:MAG TPA: Ig-like domain repeat protein [Solirubrobacterales bacterium]